MSGKKAEEKKAAITKTATEIFIEKGYKGTSLQDIARGAGLTKAGLYHYFKTKEEILYHILASHDQENIQAFVPIRTEVESGTVDPANALKKIIRGYATLSASRQKINLLGMRERDQLTGVNRENYRKINQRILSDIKGDISKFDNIKKNLDLNTIVFMVFSMSAWFGYWLKTGGRLTLEEAIEQSIDIICHGVMEKN